jgi:hypothetical protein
MGSDVAGDTIASAAVAVTAGVRLTLAAIFVDAGDHACADWRSSEAILVISTVNDRGFLGFGGCVGAGNQQSMSRTRLAKTD